MGKKNFTIQKKLVYYSYLVITPILLFISLCLFWNNYRKDQKSQQEINQKNVENLSSSLDNLLNGVSEFGTYICINNEITQLLMAEDAKQYNTDSRLWIHNAPMSTLQDMIALSGQIKTLAIYPENGIKPYLRCTDAASYFGSMEEVKDTEIYQAAKQQKGKAIFRFVSKEGGETYQGNRSDKIVMYREIFDRAKSRPLGYLVIGASAEKYKELCSNSLPSKDAGILVVSGDGEVLISCGVMEDAMREQLLAKEGMHENKSGERIFCMTSAETGVTVYEVLPKAKMRENLIAIAADPLLLLIGFLTGLYPILVFLSELVSKPLKKVCIAMRNFKGGDFSQRVEVTTQDEVGEVAECFNEMVDDMKKLIDNNYVMALKEKESELNALQAQINPHFLYNTLDTLYWQATNEGNEQIAENILALSNLFRLVLGQGKGIVSIRNEADLLKQYLSIQKMRFFDNLDYEIDIEDAILEMEIPKLILQPFVENAVVHGFEKAGEDCTISVSGQREDGYIRFEITDNGVGMNEAQQKAIWNGEEDTQYKGQRIGRYAIRNVKERLELMYHGDAFLTILSQKGVGTSVIIEIPLQNDTKRGGEEDGGKAVNRGR